MKPKGKGRLLLGAAALVLAAVGAVLLFGGMKPLRHLRAQDLASVTLQLSPSGGSVRIEKEDFPELAGILSGITVCPDKDADLAGQWANFNLVKKDGTQLRIGLCDPVLSLDGTGYRCRGAAGRRLEEFARRIWNQQAREHLMPTPRAPQLGKGSGTLGFPRPSFKQNWGTPRSRNSLLVPETMPL